MAEEVKKKGYGRRSNFIVTDEMLEEITKLSSCGLNQKQIRNYYGISQTSWQRKRLKCPELLVSYNQGKSKGIAFASAKLMELIKKGNFQAIKFFLETVGEFNEAPDFEEEGQEEVKKPKSALTISVTDPIEAAKIYQEIMRGTIS